MVIDAGCMPPLIDILVKGDFKVSSSSFRHGFCNGDSAVSFVTFRSTTQGSINRFEQKKY